ncbi:MAG: YDG domain-containing protein [Ferruginibacter sp.]
MSQKFLLIFQKIKARRSIKSFLISILFIGISTNGFAGSGLFDAYAIFNINNAGNTYHGYNTIQGWSIGNFTYGASTLILRGAQIKTYKNGGSNVTGGQIAYRVYLTGGAVPSFSYIQLPFVENYATPGDQRWETNTSSVNLLSGRSVGNYTVEIYFQAYTSDGDSYYSNFGNNFKATFSVTTAPLTITGVTANNKVYNGLTPTTLSGTAAYSGLQNGESFSVTGTPSANFNNASVGNGKTVTVAGYTAPTSNYSVSQPTGLTANITAAPLTITSVTASNKPYDGTTTASLSGTPVYNGLQNSESFSVSGTPSANFNTPAVGTAKTVTVTGYTAPNGNYTVSQPTGLSADINTVNLLITGITADSRPYNGNNTATLSGTAAYSGLQNGESFSVSGTPSATFDDENVGTGKTVTVSGYTAPSSNYTVSQPSLSADISPRTLTVTATGIDKAYDGTTTATVTLGDDRVSGDDLSTTYTFAAFVTAAAGSNKTVNVSGISLNGGSDQGNYTLGNSTTSTTANITGVSESSANFRSRANGSLSSASTWEFDGGGGGYVNATVKPGTGNNVEILHNVTFDEGFTVGAGKTLKVTSGTADFNGQLVTFKSTAAGTASFGPLLGSLTGENNVTVERYIPNGNRSWRLLSAPTHTSGQTVRQAWMEGDANPSANQNNAPGYGTIITAVAAQVANGFDATATNTSIRTYNGSTFVAMNSVNVALASTSGYFLYIRGDRSITPAGTSTSATTLRSHGTLYKGTQTSITIPANTFGLVGNIYASEIDFDNITKSNVVNTLYVWDAKMGATGGYETFPGIDDFKASTGGGSWALNEVNSKVQSGQAFFVAATNVNGSVTLSESAKSTGSSTKGLRPAAQSAVSKLKTRLLAGDKAYDGNVVVFNNKYQNTIDANDAPKFDNPGENFAIVSEGKQLAAEARQLAGTESIAYAMKNMKQQDYALEFTATNLGSGEAYLEDKFLGTKTPVSLTGVTKVSFSVTADPQSAAAGRFQLVLRPAAAPAVDNRIASISVYPNPVETGTMNVQFVKQAKGKYNLKLVDLAGRVVYSSVREHAGGSAAQSVQLPSAIGRGSYQLVITNPDKTKQVQQLFINK